MACREEKKQIGENEYYCRQWPAEKSITMKFKLAQFFGSAFFDLCTMIANNDVSNISGVIGKLFSNGTTPESITAFMKEIVCEATCNGKRIDITNFNELFTDNLIDFYKVFIFVLGVNYANFLPGKLPDILSKAEGMIQGVTQDK